MPIDVNLPLAAIPAGRLSLTATSARGEEAGVAGYCSAWWGCTPFASDGEDA